MIDRVKGALLRHRAGRAIFLLFWNLDEHHAPLAASAMAFDAFLSLVPLAAMAGWVLNYLHESRDVVLGPIFRAAPGPVTELVDDAFVRLSASGAAVVAPLSVAAFLWTSSAGLSTAISVFEAVFKSPPRPFWRRRLVAIGWVLGGLAIVAVLTALALLVRGLSGTLPGRAAAIGVPPLVMIGMLYTFFRFTIRGPRPLKRRVMPGVLVTTALWSATSAVFSIYVSRLARYATLYGGLAAVAIFLLWLWLLALALLVGGEVNAQLEGIRDGNMASLPPGPPGPSDLALISRKPTSTPLPTLRSPD